MMAAAAATAGTTAANTAIQASMNADGDFFKQVKDISKDTWDATTSRDAFESYAIAAASAGITAGATQYLNGVTNGAIQAGNAANATATQQLTTALSESAISSTTSVAVQSALAGESFSEALKEQGINLIAGTVGNFGAKQIGELAHGNITDNVDGTFTYSVPEINKATQLTLHAGLGALTSLITGNDALSGAVSGVIGEITADILRNNGVSKQTGTEMAGLTAGLSVIITGKIIGLDNDDIASNIYSGQRLGKIVSENNAYMKKRGLDLPLIGATWIPYLSSNIDSSMDINNKEWSHEQIFPKITPDNSKFSCTKKERKY